jgi:iron complex outermembrane receptor protein
MRQTLIAALATASALATAAPSYGQDTAPSAEGADTGEIIVTARRREESLQDVPLTVNAVTNESIQKLNLRQFEDVAALIPGLTLNGVNSSVRGIAFNQIVSGSSSTIGFYLNDAPVPATDLQQALFDVGQVELLRGPQGTLRGKASPSGAMTLTTRRPDLDEFGGYFDLTGTSHEGVNVNGAIGIPILRDVLAVRVAGIYDYGPSLSPGFAHVESINSGIDSLSRNYAFRATTVFEPMDNLSFIFTAQNYWSVGRRYTQLESLEAYDPTSAVVSPELIRASDRRGRQDTPERTRSKNESYNLQARFSFAGQQLNYVGQRLNSDAATHGVGDITDAFGPTASPLFQGYGQFTNTRVKSWVHEVRLSSAEQIAGLFDYTLGYFRQKNNTPTNFVIATPVLLPPALGGPRLVQTPVLRGNREKEESFFGNVVLHLGDATEISAGARHIKYTKNAFVQVPAGTGPLSAVQNDTFNTWIWTASAKHNFSEDFMAYATVGTSWRPGSSLVGLQGDTFTARQLQFTQLSPEKSTSYEVGIKSSFLDNRMRLNVSAFYQDFKNFPFSGSRPTYIVFAGGVPQFPTSTAFNFAAGVPAKVYGGELEWSFSPSEHWDMNAGLSYAHSKISNGLVACNDYNPVDGIPDTTTASPTVTDIFVATDGEGVGACRVNGIPASNTPEWTANFMTEYRAPLSSATDGFARGLFNWYDSYKNEFSNPVDDVKSYVLLNLYAGVRDHSGMWEFSIYAKNVTNTRRVLGRDQSAINPPAAGHPPTGYRRITGYTPPREFGATLRYTFGSR